MHKNDSAGNSVRQRIDAIVGAREKAESMASVNLANGKNIANKKSEKRQRKWNFFKNKTNEQRGRVGGNEADGDKKRTRRIFAAIYIALGVLIVGLAVAIVVVNVTRGGESEEWVIVAVDEASTLESCNKIFYRLENDQNYNMAFAKEDIDTMMESENEIVKIYSNICYAKYMMGVGNCGGTESVAEKLNEIEPNVRGQGEIVKVDYYTALANVYEKAGNIEQKEKYEGIVADILEDSAMANANMTLDGENKETE